MPSRFQFSLATILLLVACCALAMGLIASFTWRQLELLGLQHQVQELRVRLYLPRDVPSDAVIRDWPMTITMSEWGDFGVGNSWTLSVNSAGDAQVTIHTLPNDTLISFVVPSKQIAELRELLIQEQFFALDEGYGEIVPDGSTTTIAIAVGEVTKTVRLHFLMNWVHGDRTKLREPARAVRVGMLIRGWFQHSEAADLRKYDQIVLDAAIR